MWRALDARLSAYRMWALILQSDCLLEIHFLFREGGSSTVVSSTTADSIKTSINSGCHLLKIQARC